jgi:phosphinothricin acetyltransferase
VFAGNNVIIRQASSDDAAAMLEIYRPVVEDTAISFELAVPTVEDFASRIEKYLATHEWLVAEQDGEIAGYAYASPHRPRAAYRFSAEVSVYVHPQYQGKGVGMKLYAALFDSIRKRGFHHAYAGITLPNDASVALHKACGFSEIGTFSEVGFKYDCWHDVSWWQRKI